ncbi:deoxyribonuclease-2-alpha-like [Acipenser ruthenus]|uniref:deoxyribonuclease-2-alpha-like n=1 Tax=Acipenser ruthenus TaxID=7906 RepID=UPI0027424D19|nr:deoxyribonuclease-2-alpha-like [Acipenser ruthenus]
MNSSILQTERSGQPGARTMKYLLYLLFLSSLLDGAVAAVSCYNDNGEPVDWFFLYKLPRPRQRPLEDGLRYMYLDSENQDWREGRGFINQSEGAVGRTLEQLYKLGESSEVAYVLYNDQPPRKEKERRDESKWRTGYEKGHTKGVVLLDRSQGFWLVHSTPHFPPPLPGEFSYPSSGVHNGQSFLCVTYSYAQFSNISEQVFLNQPDWFNISVPEPFATDCPGLQKLAQEESVKAPWKSQSSLTSLGGTAFISFAKAAQFNDALYHSWVAPALGSDLLVQFWPNSAGVLPSNCSPPQHVLNVQEIGFPPGAGAPPPFSSHVDHSKWCVSEGEAAGAWTCVGDVNRDQGEERRGGGTVCIDNRLVWKSYRQLVQKYSKCED